MQIKYIRETYGDNWLFHYHELMFEEERKQKEIALHNESFGKSAENEQKKKNKLLPLSGSIDVEDLKDLIPPKI
jgi:U3 small nucleolar RNA-associated protein 14